MLLVLLQIPVLLRLPLLLVVLLLFSSLQSVLAVCLCDAKVCIKVCEPAVGILHWFPAARLCVSWGVILLTNAAWCCCS